MAESIKSNSLKVHVMPENVHNNFLANNRINENEIYLVEDNDDVIPLSAGGTGVAVTSVAELRTTLGVAAADHTSTDVSCGTGSDLKFGHVKLSDDINSEDDASAGVAATPLAIKKIMDEVNKISDILYEPISITSFSTAIKEMGSTVNTVTLSWKFNKTPTKLILNDGTSDDTLDINATNKTINDLSITMSANKTWTLKATDERGATDTKTITVTFCNNIYYGIGDMESGFDSAFITTNLTKRLQASKVFDFSVTPESKYVYYAIPERLGTVTFKVGGFAGGFEAPVVVSVTNGSGYTENYNVYRSTNKVSGSISVDVN